MHLLGCVYVQRDDVRGSVQALKDAAAVVRGGGRVTIFPEGTRYKGGEGGGGGVKGGAGRHALQAGGAGGAGPGWREPSAAGMPGAEAR